MFEEESGKSVTGRDLLITFGILVFVGLLTGKTLGESTLTILGVYGILLGIFGLICGVIYLTNK